MQTSTFDDDNFAVDNNNINNVMPLSAADPHESDKDEVLGDGEEEKQEYEDDYELDHIYSDEVDHNFLDTSPTKGIDAFEERVMRLEKLGSSSKVSKPKTNEAFYPNCDSGFNIAESDTLRSSLSFPHSPVNTNASKSKLRNNIQPSNEYGDEDNNDENINQAIISELNQNLSSYGFIPISAETYQTSKNVFSQLEKELIEKLNESLNKIKELGDTIKELVDENELNERKNQKIAETIDADNKKLRILQIKFDEMQARNAELETILVLSNEESAKEIEKTKREVKQLKKDFDLLEFSSKKIVEENKALKSHLKQSNSQKINGVYEDHVFGQLKAEKYHQIHLDDDDRKYSMTEALNEQLEQQNNELREQLQSSKSEIKKLSGYLKEFLVHNEKQLEHLPLIQASLEDKEQEIEKLKNELASRPTAEEWSKSKSHMDNLNRKLQAALGQMNSRSKALDLANSSQLIGMSVPSTLNIPTKRNNSEPGRYSKSDEDILILDEVCKILKLSSPQDLTTEIKKLTLKARALSRVRIFLNEICELVIAHSDKPFPLDIAISDPSISPEVLSRIIPQIKSWIHSSR